MPKAALSSSSASSWPRSRTIQFCFSSSAFWALRSARGSRRRDSYRPGVTPSIGPRPPKFNPGVVESPGSFCFSFGSGRLLTFENWMASPAQRPPGNNSANAKAVAARNPFRGKDFIRGTPLLIFKVSFLGQGSLGFGQIRGVCASYESVVSLETFKRIPAWLTAARPSLGPARDFRQCFLGKLPQSCLLSEKHCFKQGHGILGSGPHLSKGLDRPLCRGGGTNALFSQ